MSKKSDAGIRNNLDLFGALVGFIFIAFVVLVADIGQDRREDFYQNNPDIVPGTYLFIGIVFLTPLFFYGIWLFAKGIWALGMEALERASENAGQAN